MRKLLQTALVSSLFLVALTLAAQEKGTWHAASNTAQSITGDIAIANQKITISFVGFPISRIRTLEKSEISAIFDVDTNAEGAGSLYKLNVPAATKFLRHNTLCGSDDTQWMVTYVSGRTLQIAFFSSQKVPTFTRDAISNSTDLCGTFTYTK